jgi:AraC family transcriptional regulator
MDTQPRNSLNRDAEPSYSDEPPSSHHLHQTVTTLVQALGRILRDHRESPESRLSRAERVLRSCSLAVESYHGRDHNGRAVFRGGLAPWQVHRVTGYIDLHLSGVVSTQVLANLAELSPAHFSRAFRESLNEPPHRYVMRKRVEQAIVLMITSNAPLCHIAPDCGLSDQSHLTRLFRRFTGETPGAWRRRARVNMHAGSPPDSV